MSGLSALLGQSAAIAAVRDMVDRLVRQHAASERFPPILIQGETGTGKNLLARVLHESGPRRHGPLVDVNCAAIPDTLLEAELFGFERGAFTDARQPKPGLFQAASGGTLFLDELALLPRPLQGKLLTVVEERVVRRLGSTRSEPVDIWIVAATSEDLPSAVRDGRFHEALYYRLSVVTLSLPPLRERGADIAALAEHFLDRACAHHKVARKVFTPEAVLALTRHDWPGNVRELINVIERAVMSEAHVLTPKELALSIGPRRDAAPRRSPALRDEIDGLERERLVRALTETKWIITHAAARLGIPANTLRYRMRKQGLAPAAPTLSSSTPRTAEPTNGATPAVWSSGIRWTPRWVAMLRAVPVSREVGTASFEASRALVTLAQSVESFAGRVVDVSPSALVVAFGLEPIEDAPRRAVHAARAMLAAVEHMGSGATSGCSAKIGIHVTRLSVGETGEAPFIDADARRRVWDTLAPLTDGAEPGTVVASPEAASFLRTRFELVPAPAPGDTLAPVYRVYGEERSVLAFPGGNTTFVGRAEELELLHRRLEAAVRGHGQVVGIGGDAGIGKSRLLFEFRKAMGGQPVAYIVGRCLSHASTIPYTPLVDLVRQACGIADGDTPAMLTGKVRQRLEDASIDSEEAARYLLTLLGVADRADQSGSLAGEELRARTFETFRRLLLKESGRRPIVIAVEDLHWIDPTSEELLASLMGALPGARILLLLTYRSGYRPAWTDRSFGAHIALQPLSPDESRTLVQSSLGAANTEVLADAIVKKAEGNPFFLEELTRAVGRDDRDTGAIATIPDTIQGVLMARIEQLPAEERQVLQCASVVGRSVPFDLLRSVAELSDATLLRVLSRLRDAELLYETDTSSAADCVFKHALIQEVTCASLPGLLAQALHVETVKSVERLYADRLDEWIEHLAHHARAGELWDRAVHYAARAGRKAMVSSAYVEAVAYFEQALGCLEQLPGDRIILEQGLDLRLELRTALMALGEYGKVRDCLRDTLAVAEGLNDPRRLTVILASIVISYWSVGDAFQSLEIGQRALTIAESLGDIRLLAETRMRCALAHHALGDCGRAIELLEKSVDSMRDDLVHERANSTTSPAVMSRAHLGRWLADHGAFHRAMLVAQEGVRIAETGQQPYGILTAYWGISGVRLFRGELDAAVASDRAALDLCERFGIRLWAPVFSSEMGYAHALSGRTGEGLALIQRA